MYTVIKEEDKFYVTKGGVKISAPFWNAAEAWEMVDDLKSADRATKYQRWGLSPDKAISEDREEELAKGFKESLINFWNRFHVAIMFIACVAAISSWAWFV